jgi:hypothetical protein
MKNGNRKKSKYEIMANIAVVVWVSFWVFAIINGLVLAGVILLLAGTPVVYLSFAFMETAQERKKVLLSVEAMRATLNGRVGTYTYKDACEFEDDFNSKRPDDIWHDVNITNEAGEIIMHVVHYWHDGTERKWNSELLMKFSNKDKILREWELKLAKGSSALTKDTKTRVMEKYDVIYGP